MEFPTARWSLGDLKGHENAVKILADNSVKIQFIINRNSTTDANQDFVVSLRKVSMIWDQISDSIQHVIAKSETVGAKSNDR